MDDLTAYYAPPIHHPYYQPPPPPPPGTAHHPPSAVAHVQPQIVAYAPQVYPQSSHDQVRTLFIAGLPDDVKPRELYNLFRECPGYQSSNLRPPTSSNTQFYPEQTLNDRDMLNSFFDLVKCLRSPRFESKASRRYPFAFATFADQQTAIMALHAFNGMVFDLEKGSTLYIDLAKSNSRSKRSRTDDESQVSEKRQKGSVAFSRSDDPGLGSIHTPGMGNSAYNTIGYSSTQSLRNIDGGSVSGASSKSNSPPCPTLFVANLGQGCTEEELMQVFSRCPGFLKLKIQSTYGSPVAFVDFQDTASSTEALSHLQGTVLYSSTSGEGMRLEYAKSRMGMRSKKSR